MFPTYERREPIQPSEPTPPSVTPSAAARVAPAGGVAVTLAKIQKMAESGYFFIGDLLGFSRMVENLAPRELATRVDEWVQLIQSSAEQAGITRFQMISDTVFASAEPTADGLNRLLMFSTMLLNRGVPQSLPVRGAISFGDFVWGALTYGKAVIEGHRLEQRQQWIGIACQAKLPHVAKMWSPARLVCYPAPLSTGKIMLQPVVVWEIPKFSVLTKALTGKGLTREGEQLEWEWAHKLSNTIQFRLYLALIRKGGVRGDVFHGMHPLEIVDESLK